MCTRICKDCNKTFKVSSTHSFETYCPKCFKKRIDQRNEKTKRYYKTHKR